MVKDVGGWVTGNPKLCTHSNAYTNELAGVKVCPDCNCMRISGFLNKRTGERLGDAISGKLSDELGSDLGFWEEWVPNPGEHRILSAEDEARRQRMLDRAFSADTSDYGEY